MPLDITPSNALAGGVQQADTSMLSMDGDSSQSDRMPPVVKPTAPAKTSDNNLSFDALTSDEPLSKHSTATKSQNDGDKRNDYKSTLAKNNPIKPNVEVLADPDDKSSEDTDEDTDITDDKEPTKTIEDDTESEELDKSAADEEVTPATKTKRDFTGFDKEEIKLLKNIDNQRFNKLSAKWRELKSEAAKATELTNSVATLTKQLRDGGVPESWVDHPQAYTLSPRYQQLSHNMSVLDFEETFYEQQLERIKAGEDYQEINGWHKGQPQYSQALKASNQADIAVSRRLARAEQLRGSFQNQLGQVQQEFQSTYNNAGVGTKKLVDDLVKALPDHLKPKEDDEKLLFDAMHPGRKGSAEAYALAKTYAVCKQQALHIQKLEAQINGKTKLNNDQRRAGPNPNKTPRDPSSGSVTDARGKVSVINGNKVTGALSFDKLLED